MATANFNTGTKTPFTSTDTRTPVPVAPSDAPIIGIAPTTAPTATFATLADAIGSQDVWSWSGTVFDSKSLEGDLSDAQSDLINFLDGDGSYRSGLMIDYPNAAADRMAHGETVDDLTEETQQYLASRRALCAKLARYIELIDADDAKRDADGWLPEMREAIGR